MSELLDLFDTSDSHKRADRAWLKSRADAEFGGDVGQALAALVRASRLVEEARADLAAEDAGHRRRGPVV